MTFKWYHTDEWTVHSAAAYVTRIAHALTEMSFYYLWQIIDDVDIYSPKMHFVQNT